MAGNSPVTRLVVLPLILVHSAIQLDRQSGGVAVEIDDVSVDYLRTAEVKSVYRISPKGLP